MKRWIFSTLVAQGWSISIVFKDEELSGRGSTGNRQSRTAVWPGEKGWLLFQWRNLKHPLHPSGVAVRWVNLPLSIQRLGIVKKLETSRKSKNCMILSPSTLSFPKNNNFVNIVQNWWNHTDNFSDRVLFYMNSILHEFYKYCWFFSLSFLSIIFVKGTLTPTCSFTFKVNSSIHGMHAQSLDL